MEKKNIFIVGPVARSESFWGRRKQIQDLTDSLYHGVGAIHLVGPTRIGKSSLINRVIEDNRDTPNHLTVMINMGECAQAYDFWSMLANELQEQVEDSGLWDDSFEKAYQGISFLDSGETSNWFLFYRIALGKILRHIGKLKCRLVLVIDEFDSAPRVFENQSHYFQLLRSIYSDAKYVTSGVIISRKRLHLLESNCADISTFHGVFRELTLHGFSDEDMEEYYHLFQRYGIILSEDAKTQLVYYTGKMPYLCCMFGERMAFHMQDLSACSAENIREVFRECLPQINQYYDDLVKRLEKDNQIEVVFYCSIGSRMPRTTERDIENMCAMGILFQEETEPENKRYYAYCHDFMTYIQTLPMKLEIWPMMMESERKLKRIFGLEYPILAQTRYLEFTGDNQDAVRRNVNCNCSNIHIDWRTVVSYAKDLANHKDNPSVLDVLTLSYIIKYIVCEWDRRFYRYFNGDSEWKRKLKTIADTRKPMAHAHELFIDEKDLSVCMKYCKEIVNLEIPTT